MTQEEKLEEAKKLYKDANADQRYVLERLFPELKESEDEIIREAILNYMTIMWGNSQDDVCGVQVEDAIAWLEKQGEQKPAWSEEDDDNMIMIEDRLSDYLDYIREDSSYTKHQKNSLKEEVVGYVNWLKSLKDKHTWKPSEHELEVLKLVAERDGTCLMGLYKQLKKLKE